tara:strand:- start:269 stop:421 length:153 start_codon:yes stop_codon:yes gene_type:complete
LEGWVLNNSGCDFPPEAAFIRSQSFGAQQVGNIVAIKATEHNPKKNAVPS